ncbi:hypothetical protein [Nocardia sp. NPDC052566]|uniref:hypothetical protein n=1 Tax=Nocardia sp. NPDC052566 TaxID=3364330 RepID=UPI0037C93D83
MADQPDTKHTRRGPSSALLIVGLIALAVSVWAIVGPAALPSGTVIPFGWILVFAAIITGGLLVLSGRRR